jgi:hypothetical protein
MSTSTVDTATAKLTIPVTAQAIAIGQVAGACWCGADTGVSAERPDAGAVDTPW